MKKSKAPAPQWEDRGIFPSFVKGLCLWSQGGGAPRAADSDLRFVLDLQKQRLQKLGLNLEYDISPRGLLSADRQSRLRREGRFEMEQSWRSCLLKTRLTQGDRPLYFRQEREILYLTVTRLRGGELPAQAPCACPACGAVSPAELLAQKGCPYCGGRFSLGDLYPKVSNFYFVRDSGMTREELKGSMTRWMLAIGGFVLFMLLPLRLPQCFSNGFHPLPLIGALLQSAAFGLIFGYLGYSLYLLGVTIKEAAGSLSLLPHMMGTRRRLTEFFRNLDPDFSYEYFMSKMTSLLKIILLAEDPQTLPNYRGGALPQWCSGILEVSFRGGLGLNGCTLEGNRVRLDVSVFAVCLEGSKEKVRRRNRVFRMTVCRELGPSEPQALRHVQCPACGGSFDATRQRCCPYCDTPYDLSRTDWVAEQIQIF